MKRRHQHHHHNHATTATSLFPLQHYTILLCLLLFLSPSFAFRSHQQQKKRGSYYRTLLTKIYHETDHNQDGTLSFDECYERLLYFYVHLNRRAALEPPTRTALAQLYQAQGWTSPLTKQVTLEEFTDILVPTLVGQASVRFCLYKMTSIGVAPYVAMAVVQRVTRRNDNDSNTIMLRRSTTLTQLLWALVRTRKQQLQLWISLVSFLGSKQLPTLGVKWLDNRRRCYKRARRAAKKEQAEQQCKENDAQQQKDSQQEDQKEPQHVQ